MGCPIRTKHTGHPTRFLCQLPCHYHLHVTSIAPSLLCQQVGARKIIDTAEPYHQALTVRNKVLTNSSPFPMGGNCLDTLCCVILTTVTRKAMEYIRIWCQILILSQDENFLTIWYYHAMRNISRDDSIVRREFRGMDLNHRSTGIADDRRPNIYKHRSIAVRWHLSSHPMSQSGYHYPTPEVDEWVMIDCLGTL